MHVCCSPLAVVAFVITFLAALIVAQTIFALVLTTIAAAAPARTTGAALILLSIAGGYRERGEYDSEDLHLSFLLLGALITVAPLNNGISSARCLLLRKSLRLAWSMSKIQIYSCRHFYPCPRKMLVHAKLPPTSNFASRGVAGSQPKVPRRRFWLHYYVEQSSWTGTDCLE